MNEAELVFTHALNCDRLSLYMNKDARLSPAQSRLISKIFERRMKGEPLQYILGYSEFMGYRMKVDRRCLIPRMETEILVQAASDKLKQLRKNRPKILDLGTGSGCIAVSLAKIFPHSEIWAGDSSENALRLAKENADLNNVKIEFIKTEFFKNIKSEAKFDLIISNPPYIAAGELSGLSREISFEPKSALNGGSDGLECFRRIIKNAGQFLTKGGLLALEVGIYQSGKVKSMCLEFGFAEIEVIKDYCNIERVIIAKARQVNG